MDNEETVTKENEFKECLELCQRGVKMCRIKAGRLMTSQNVYVEDQKWLCYHSNVCWKFVPLKLKSINIDNILEVRKGFSSDNLHKASKKYSFREKVTAEMCLSVILTHRRMLHKSVDFAAENLSVRDKFVKGLQYLVDKKNQKRVHFDEERWLLDNFRKADINKDGSLSFDEILKLLKTLNLQISNKYARALYTQADSFGKNDGKLDEKEFLKFFSHLTDRPDLEHAMRMFSATSDLAFSAFDLKTFLTTEQEFDDIDENKAASIIDSFESAKQGAKILGPIGFRWLLLGKWGNIMKPGHEGVFQDMDHTLSHYYVSSSHNTYLTGLQIKGEATVEGYINALKKGVRLLELDVFDGEEGEPCITHKRTFIRTITLKDVLKEIDAYAFKANPYPVILTIENHVGLPQQKAMSRIFKEVLGDKIYMRPKNGASQPLPSPNALKNKYLLRGKKLRSEQGPDRKFDQDSDEIIQDSKESKDTIKLDPEFSELISLPSVKLSRNIFKDIDEHPMDGSSSLSEGKVANYMESGYSLAAYTSKRFVKSFPKGMRQDSSNMDPIPSWLCGVQSVAMNMQTTGEYLDLVNGLFRTNGNCGYVLKSKTLIDGLDPRMPEVSSAVVTTMLVGVISGQYLPMISQANDVVDPYVTVEIFGIPADSRKFRTKTIRNNGFNPQFNETFTFPLHFPDFALLRFCVKDFDSTSANDFVGEYTIPVKSIRAGYSHIRLNTGNLRTVDECASLFVRIALE
ncbi:phosphatidylinositol-specific phospholipase C [Loa loa]|uniref:Phosphoinositide phospholipase C n=1 Tax=Loa loa TaxID=7209 RepID=A0A1I7W0W0_LOALO|nr:phosphatidylinositol-specific phospholipase C [Loa loa]EFO25701.2 phosphatidylinositol-specific phospholipase C [Loa loa]